jgi:hypothetical protein
LKRNRVKNSSFIIVMLVMFAACGFKGNPVPYSLTPDKKPVINSMEALSMGETVVLRWNFQNKNGLIGYINIERSEVGSPGNECKNCPRTFVGIGRITVKEGKPDDREQKAHSFTDVGAVKGNIYDYRLMLCEENGNCSEAATAEINFK